MREFHFKIEEIIISLISRVVEESNWFKVPYHQYFRQLDEAVTRLESHEGSLIANNEHDEAFDQID